MEIVHFGPDSNIITELPKTRLMKQVIFGETDHFSYYTVWKNNVYTSVYMRYVNGTIAVNVNIGSRCYGEFQGLSWIVNLLSFEIASGHVNAWCTLLDPDYDDVKLLLRVDLCEDGFWHDKRVTGYGIVVFKIQIIMTSEHVTTSTKLPKPLPIKQIKVCRYIYKPLIFNLSG